MKTLGLQVEMIKLKNVSCFPPLVTFGQHPIRCPVDTKQSVKCMLLFSCWVVSHGLQHTRLPCPSLSPGVSSDSCALSQWCPPTISSSFTPFSFCLHLPSMKVFSSGLTLRIRWPKYWSFSFNISPSSECSGLISFRIDWFDRFAVQGTLKSLLQHHHSKASILWHSACFIVPPSHAYLTNGKTIALTRQTFAGKVISLLLNMLSR